MKLRFPLPSLPLPSLPLRSLAPALASLFVYAGLGALLSACLLRNDENPHGGWDDFPEEIVALDLKEISANLETHFSPAPGVPALPKRSAGDGECLDGFMVKSDTVPADSGFNIYLDSVWFYNDRDQPTCDLDPPDYLGWEFMVSYEKNARLENWSRWRKDYTRRDRYRISGRDSTRMVNGFIYTVDTLVLESSLPDTGKGTLTEFTYVLGLQGGRYRAPMAMPPGAGYRFLGNDEETRPTPEDMVLLSGPIQQRSGRTVGYFEIVGPRHLVVIRDRNRKVVERH